MRIRQWEPATAPPAELQAWLGVYNDALAADLPGDPRWSAESLREFLTISTPDERRLAWVAADDSDEVVGSGRLSLLDGLGVVEVLVKRQARRAGVGRALLAVMARRALDEGFESLGVEAASASAVRFYQHVGFAHAYTETRSILDLAGVDWAHIEEMASGIVTGYRVEFHAGGLPEAMLPTYAEAKQERWLRELELRPSSYTPQRLRESIACLNARGLKPYFVVAVNERYEEVAALTELVVPAQRPGRADQYDTVVVPKHDGLGLPRAIKARMLLELRQAEPQLGEVQTWHAADRLALAHLNAELGFRADREWYEFEADTADLVARLGTGLAPSGW